jgi:hypothetical protein
MGRKMKSMEETQERNEDIWPVGDGKNCGYIMSIT